jgi:hypothetical protein
MRTRRVVPLYGLAIVALLAVAVSVALTAGAAPRSQSASPPLSGPARDAADRARADLSDRLAISAEKIEVLSCKPHTWPDTSLDLPEPGMVYAQVRTDGSIVTLRAEGRDYTYHVAGEAVRLKTSAS